MIDKIIHKILDVFSLYFSCFMCFDWLYFSLSYFRFFPFEVFK